MEATTKVTGAEQVFWDLSDLYPSTEHESFKNDLGSIVARAEAFRATWSGTFATATDDQMVAFVEEYSAIIEKADRLGSFTQLRWTTNTDDPEYGRTLQTVRETLSGAWQWMVFVSTEMNALEEARLDHFINAPSLAPWKHWFEVVKKTRKHVLTEEVEKVLSEKSLTSRAAWVRLHDELMAAETYALDGQEHTEAQILKLLHDPNRDKRKAAAEVFSNGLKRGAKTHAFIYNTVIADVASNTRMRSYASWVSSRNEDNEVSDASVQGLVDAVVAKYSIVERFYNLKRRLLGLDEMFDYDRYAPVGGDSGWWTWDQCRELVVKAYTDFHPEAGEIAGMFFDKPWIHAPVMKGKNGGAYSAGTTPLAHPYVFLNYMGTNRDVQVVAHELGHGIHQYLSRRNGQLLADTPLTIAETASVFGEMLTFQTLVDRMTSDKERLALIMGKLDDIIATVFRQIALNRFENVMHVTRAAEGELSVDRLCELWMSTQQSQFGSSVTFTEGYRYWWSYISHFMHVPGYVYAYAYGELLVLALYGIYKKEGATFPEKYMDLLRAGGSKSPEELLAPFGCDINDPSFWSVGLQAIEELLQEAEALAG